MNSRACIEVAALRVFVSASVLFVRSNEIEMLKKREIFNTDAHKLRCQFKSLHLDREKYGEESLQWCGMMACKECDALMCSPAIVCVAIFVVFILMIRLFRYGDMEREVAGLHIMRRYIFNGSQPYYSSQCININSISNVWPLRNIRFYLIFGRVCAVCEAIISLAHLNIHKTEEVGVDYDNFSVWFDIYCYVFAAPHK